MSKKPCFKIPENRIITGDAIEVLKKFPDNCIDSIVTDPPYELGFMGKKWDNTGVAYNVDLWREVLRVLKPGGHLLSFGGSRTYHRMACAIEDAGFEIRDQIMWVYGCLSEDTEILTINGWERYHKTIDNNPVLCYDVDNNSFEFHKPKRSFIYENKHTAYRIFSDNTDQIVSRNHRVLVERGGKLSFTLAEELAREQEADIPFLESLSDLPETIYNAYEGTSITKQKLLNLCKSKAGEVEQGKIQSSNLNMSSLWNIISAKVWKSWKILLTFLPSKSKYRTSSSILRKWKREIKTRQRIEGREKSCVERWSNILSQARQLCSDKICQVSERILGYGSQGRLCYGAPAYNGSISQAVPTKNRGSSSYQPQSTGQSFGKFAIIQDQPTSQTPRRTKAEVIPIEYKGNVWCVEVETGAFVARRNGKIFITGNSGFPKSLNIGKAVDKLKGNEREVVGSKLGLAGYSLTNAENQGTTLGWSKSKRNGEKECEITKGSSEWEGYGTALKPAHEPIVLARKPLSEKTVAKNVLKWGVGGLATDNCRVGTEERINSGGRTGKNPYQSEDSNLNGKGNIPTKAIGRFPANFIHDGSDEVVNLFPNTGQKGKCYNYSGKKEYQVEGFIPNNKPNSPSNRGDSGSAARFFYCAKASKKERDMGCGDMPDVDGGHYRQDEWSRQNMGNTPDAKRLSVKNNHPTVKPIALCKYLIKLITPPNGIVLDMFAGSGSTLVAAKTLGYKFIGIEKEKDYCAIAEKRIAAIKKELFKP